MSDFIIDNNTRKIFVDDSIEISFDELVKYSGGYLVLGNGSDIGIRRFYEQPAQPLSGKNGDRWFDTDDGTIYDAILINNNLVWMEA